jgi:hypothetical protein
METLSASSNYPDLGCQAEPVPAGTTPLRAILIGDPGDEFLLYVRRIMNAHGVASEIYSVPDYAELVSVAVTNGRAEVTPDIPLLFRPDLTIPDGCDFDAAFLRGEQFAVCWSAAVLSKSRVLNRPSVGGAAIPPSGLIALDALRAAAHDIQGACIPPERLSRCAGLLAGAADRQDLSTWAPYLGTITPPDGRPIRERLKRHPVEAYVEFVVAVDQAWSVRTSGSAITDDLIALGSEASKNVARCLNLDIASVTIRPAGDPSRVEICRVSGYPNLIGVDHACRRGISERVAAELEGR